MTFGVHNSLTASTGTSFTRETFKGYAGVFTREALETIQKANEVSVPSLNLLIFLLTSLRLRSLTLSLIDTSALLLLKYLIL